MQNALLLVVPQRAWTVRLEVSITHAALLCQLPVEGIVVLLFVVPVPEGRPQPVLVYCQPNGRVHTLIA